MEQRVPRDGRGWSRRWRAWLRELGLDQGDRTNARVKRLEVLPGRVTAALQERGGKSCDVEIRFQTWTDEQWQRVIDALSSQAIFAAQLLAGDMPPELEQAIAAAGISLLPASRDEVEHLCLCGQAERPCEHLSAIYMALGEMVTEEPWLLFKLRGRDQQSILRGLRTQRARGAEAASPPRMRTPEGRGAAGGFYRSASVTSRDEESAPLDQQMDGFWGNPKVVNTFRPHIMLPSVELALLRRLGSPPMGAAGGEAYDRLVALYRQISQEAMDLAYATDPEANGGESGEAG